jgi:Asp-tRNA(Asn)/Glu-tRNA(Gln) amidotransferase A subunit family amidase
VVDVPGSQGGQNGLPAGVSLVAPEYSDKHLLGVSCVVGARLEGQAGCPREILREMVI